MLLNFETELDRRGVKRIVGTPTPPPAPPKPAPRDIKIGSLCSGYGGLELAVSPLTGGRTVWLAEIDKFASKVLDVRFPGIPNLGDFRGETPESVDILTAGFPCQPVSQAGQRKGMSDERWLFDEILGLIGRMDSPPRMLMLENVPGLLTANGGRAMARVVEGLAQAGYVGRYGLLRASDVGACHQRRRWFCVALHADADYRILRSERGGLEGRQASGQWADQAGGGRLEDRHGASASSGGGHPADTLGSRHGVGGYGAGGQGGEASAGGESALVPPRDGEAHAEGGRASGGVSGTEVVTLPTPRARDYHGIGVHGKGGLDLPTTIAQRLPTPQARGHKDLLPTPTANTGRNATAGRKPDAVFAEGRTLHDIAFADWWGEYTGAILRHEMVTGVPSPSPTIEVKGRNRLSPKFVEWMMMLPPGWVTDLDLSRTQQLKILGNGVVPMQAYHAYSQLLSEGAVAEGAVA